MWTQEQWATEARVPLTTDAQRLFDEITEGGAARGDF